MKKPAVILVFAAAVVAGLAAAVVRKGWEIRDTDEAQRKARRDALKEMRATPPPEVLPALENLLAEKKLHTWFVTDSPWKFWGLRAGRLTRVPYDFVARLTEDQFIRFAGDGKDVPPDVPVLKGLLDFSAKLLPLCDTPAADSLRERRLDGFFLTDDFDSAIALLEKDGLPKKSAAWCKGTVAKLRAHKAMTAGDKKEAVAQLKIFGDFMMSDEQKDFEECDPTTSILYSREWVVARNFMRCATLSAELGDAAQSAAYKAEAAKYFAVALEKAKDDKKSLDFLKEEMKSAGL